MAFIDGFEKWSLLKLLKLAKRCNYVKTEYIQFKGKMTFDLTFLNVLN